MDAQTPSDLVHSISRKCQDSLAALRGSYNESDCMSQFSTIIEGTIGIETDGPAPPLDPEDSVLMQSPPPNVNFVDASNSLGGSNSGSGHANNSHANNNSHTGMITNKNSTKPDFMRPTACSSGRKTRKLSERGSERKGRSDSLRTNTLRSNSSRVNSTTPHKIAIKPIKTAPNLSTPHAKLDSRNNANVNSNVNATPDFVRSSSRKRREQVVSEKLSFTDCLKKKYRKSFDFRQAKVARYNLVHGFDDLSSDGDSSCDSDSEDHDEIVPRGASKFMSKLARDQVRLQVSLNREKSRANEFEKEARVAKNGLQSVASEMNLLRAKIEEQQGQNRSLVSERDAFRENLERESVARDYNESELVSLLTSAQQERDSALAELQHASEQHSFTFNTLDETWQGKLTNLESKLRESYEAEKQTYELQLRELRAELEAVKEEHSTLQRQHDEKCTDFTKLMSESQAELEFFQQELYEARMMKNLTESAVQTELRIHDIPREEIQREQPSRHEIRHVDSVEDIHKEQRQIINDIHSSTDSGIEDALVELFRQAHRPPRRPASRPFSKGSSHAPRMVNSQAHSCASSEVGAGAEGVPRLNIQQNNSNISMMHTNSRRSEIRSARSTARSSSRPSGSARLPSVTSDKPNPNLMRRKLGLTPARSYDMPSPSQRALGTPKNGTPKNAHQRSQPTFIPLSQVKFPPRHRY